MTSLPTVILETILTHLTTIFLSGASNDPAAARDAAMQMLGAYNPRTEDELRLAANIVTFSFQALQALGQAAAPDMPISRVLRLRSGAVSLSRQATQAERRLAQLQKPGQPPVQAQQPEAQPETEAPETAAHAQDTPVIATPAKVKPLTWTQAHEQRQRDLRIAASLKRAEMKVAAQQAAANQAAGPDKPTFAQAN